ncbi:MAG: ferredoxin [Candidatus Hecatellales archaeon]|nr:MAG: ferredoxin [Candidatus Hecatellales archaeon]RLI33792.1 MAG: ferredoxin [Candidatus Bathyarchaeota archaeon]
MGKELRYHLERCVGCTLCMASCPWEALTKGPIVEVAAGRLEEAPLVNVELEKCTFCGLCVSACLFNSFNLFLDGTALEDLLKVSGKHEVDREKCIPCYLCERVCPRQAIKAEVKMARKDELVVYEAGGKPEEARGKIVFDEEKCCYCGLCEALCDAFEIFWEEAKPPEFKPAIGLRIDEEKCDYCGLCEKICPTEALKVECEYAPPRSISEVKIEGEISIDEDKCVDCGICASVCPVEALKVKKPFDGKVHIVRLEKCDPTGCKNCFNICPVNVIYPVKGAEKIKVLEDYCIFCGACENACPEQVLKVERFSLNLEGVDRPWKESRIRQLQRLLGRSVEPVLLEPTYPRQVTLKIEAPKPPKEEAAPEWRIDEQASRLLHERLGKLAEGLGEKTFRIAFELGKLEKVLGRLKV